MRRAMLLHVRGHIFHTNHTHTHTNDFPINGYPASDINEVIDSTEALNTSKRDARTTLWVEEWNALGERSTEWRDRGIIPNEYLPSGTDEPWSTWRSLNRLRVQKGRCRAMMKMWSSPIQMYVTVGRDRLCLIL